MSIVATLSFVLSKSIISRGDTVALSAWIYLSVSVTFLVTCLISIRLLRLRKEVSDILPAANLRVYLGVIAILVESALPLTLCGLVFAILTQPKNVAERIPNGIFLTLWFSLNVRTTHLIREVTSDFRVVRRPYARSSSYFV